MSLLEQTTPSTIQWGAHWSYNFQQDPKRLAFVLARYHFAAQMGGKGRTVLELGCGEGIGAPILTEFAKSYTGIDLDLEAIQAAQRNFPSDPFHFIYDDFMGKTFGQFQMVVSLDVIEHIYSEHEPLYIQTFLQNLSDDGLLIVGTPNITSAPYASKGSQLGHVNLFSHDRLKKTFQHYFHQVFMFGMNDELVHTGYPPMAHYLFCVACHKKKGRVS